LTIPGECGSKNEGKKYLVMVIEAGIGVAINSGGKEGVLMEARG